MDKPRSWRPLLLAVYLDLSCNTALTIEEINGAVPPASEVNANVNANEKETLPLTFAALAAAPHLVAQPSSALRAAEGGGSLRLCCSQ